MKPPTFLSASPAPFTVEHERLTHYIVSASGQIIANVPDGLAQYDPGSRDESPSAAQAFAAMPECLAALETALYIIEGLPHPGNHHAEAIRSALTKAGYTL